MFKVAIVGHSQVPRSLSVENAEVRIFRAPGGKLENFHRDTRLNQVLSWPHNLTYLWLGSNDVHPDVRIIDLIDQNKAIASEIEEKCGSRVIIVELERRVYPPHRPVIERTRYKQITRSVNRALLRCKKFFTITFNAQSFVLASDGVHFEPQSRRVIENRFVENIKRQMREGNVP